MDKYQKLNLRSTTGFLMGMFFFAIIGTISSGFISILSYVLSVIGALGFVIFMVVFIISTGDSIESGESAEEEKLKHERQVELDTIRYGRRQ